MKSPVRALPFHEQRPEIVEKKRSGEGLEQLNAHTLGKYMDGAITLGTLKYIEYRHENIMKKMHASTNHTPLTTRNPLRSTCSWKGTTTNNANSCGADACERTATVEST